ncbi:MAG: MFS transporter, partial [Chloroflexi bacterium]|nr:MFS transporter [Chloroflexota bacterium]
MKNLEKAGQKITAALLVSQSLFSASVIMLFTISAIIAVQLANDNDQWTGVPGTLILVGAALVA